MIRQEQDGKRNTIDEKDNQEVTMNFRHLLQEVDELMTSRSGPNSGIGLSGTLERFDNTSSFRELPRAQTSIGFVGKKKKKLIRINSLFNPKDQKRKVVHLESAIEELKEQVRARQMKRPAGWNLNEQATDEGSESGSVTKRSTHQSINERHRERADFSSQAHKNAPGKSLLELSADSEPSSVAVSRAKLPPLFEEQIRSPAFLEAYCSSHKDSEAVMEDLTMMKMREEMLQQSPVEEMRRATESWMAARANTAEYGTREISSKEREMSPEDDYYDDLDVSFEHKDLGRTRSSADYAYKRGFLDGTHSDSIQDDIFSSSQSMKLTDQMQLHPFLQQMSLEQQMSTLTKVTQPFSLPQRSHSSMEASRYQSIYSRSYRTYAPSSSLSSSSSSSDSISALSSIYFDPSFASQLSHRHPTQFSSPLPSLRSSRRNENVQSPYSSVNRGSAVRADSSSSNPPFNSSTLSEMTSEGDRFVPASNASAVRSSTATTSVFDFCDSSPHSQLPVFVQKSSRLQKEREKEDYLHSTNTEEKETTSPAHVKRHPKEIIIPPNRTAASFASQPQLSSSQQMTQSRTQQTNTNSPIRYQRPEIPPLLHTVSVLSSRSSAFPSNDFSLNSPQTTSRTLHASTQRSYQISPLTQRSTSSASSTARTLSTLNSSSPDEMSKTLLSLSSMPFNSISRSVNTHRATTTPFASYDVLNTPRNGSSNGLIEMSPSTYRFLQVRQRFLLQQQAEHKQREERLLNEEIAHSVLPLGTKSSFSSPLAASLSSPLLPSQINSRGQFVVVEGQRRKTTMWKTVINAALRLAVLLDGLSEDRNRRWIKMAVMKEMRRRRIEELKTEIRKRRRKMLVSFQVLARALGRFICAQRMKQRRRNAEIMRSLMFQTQIHMIFVIRVNKFRSIIINCQRKAKSFIRCLSARYTAVDIMWRSEEARILLDTLPVWGNPRKYRRSWKWMSKNDTLDSFEKEEKNGNFEGVPSMSPDDPDEVTYQKLKELYPFELSRLSVAIEANTYNPIVTEAPAVSSNSSANYSTLQSNLTVTDKLPVSEQLDVIDSSNKTSPGNQSEQSQIHFDSLQNLVKQFLDVMGHDQQRFRSSSSRGSLIRNVSSANMSSSSASLSHPNSQSNRPLVRMNTKFIKHHSSLPLNSVDSSAAQKQNGINSDASSNNPENILLSAPSFLILEEREKENSKEMLSHKHGMNGKVRGNSGSDRAERAEKQQLHALVPELIRLRIIRRVVRELRKEWILETRPVVHVPAMGGVPMKEEEKDMQMEVDEALENATYSCQQQQMLSPITPTSIDTKSFMSERIASPRSVKSSSFGVKPISFIPKRKEAKDIPVFPMLVKIRRHIHQMVCEGMRATIEEDSKTKYGL
ncbi:uncharacterized protein MONOS_133 [Monocercomonoides exilis]|uniref:uncharacterized protein n=1 Tax=Monocercomonoides exilis TaxID=2049356 RepID=UPI003559AD3E|nr:hypothetical protein MONOS_133 [Monocercomonoides exilis]|eukprot:MONOS_133.1-p1 / transcript=MONOS_133.1 / gene=MONOS_133 / organism=Monocercomonoides_exilis_PA203 / gene_product=unspecified product / transcript_product=unspecified product / location=Mono_scaffold00002:259936-264818(-) / protein_length=1371 / sequence_SO=supercontig / SO=protein_coding / is_pseudo=false